MEVGNGVFIVAVGILAHLAGGNGSVDVRVSASGTKCVKMSMF